MNWYNEICANGLTEKPPKDIPKPKWATHSFKRMGRILYGNLYGESLIWVNEERTLYYTNEDIDQGSLLKF
jgi:hypothetical protein